MAEVRDDFDVQFVKKKKLKEGVYLRSKGEKNHERVEIERFFFHFDSQVTDGFER